MKLLWAALEDSPRLVGVRQGLADLLGAEYPVVAPFLAPNGKESKRYPCPSPGDPGCPRRIVKDNGGAVRAVCSAESKECGSLRLTRDDIQVLAFDSARFAGALQPILGIPIGVPQIKHCGDIVDLGVVRVKCGARLPVVLMMALSRLVAEGLLAEIERTYRHGAILLTPTDKLIDGETESRLAASGVIWLILADILIADGKKLAATQPLADLVSPLALPRSRPAANQSVHRFSTPPDTDWKDIQVRFTDGHTVTIRVGSVVKGVNYAEMDMKHARNGQPTVLWKLLQALSTSDGRFDWNHSEANQKVKQRVCRLRKVLKTYFGLTSDPFFKYQKGVGYRVKFRLDPEK